jgi:2-polyprenyl-6-methoxyphenol hydroxylase-like FAD-dependent oxidoreductase
MTSKLAHHAVVIGAGMGGLTAAGALAPHFEQVTVIERDRLPTRAEHRAGTPQARHVHALLAGGQQALEALFPGFQAELEKTGAVRLRAGRDVRMERPGFNPYPQRDLGFDSYAMSRPLVELVVRQLTRRCPNVTLRTECRAQALEGLREGVVAVTGVRVQAANGDVNVLDADLVVDASGRAALTMDFLEATGQPRPAETTIGVDIHYATAVYAIPANAPRDWRGVFTFAQPPSGRGALMLPLEDGRWIVTLGGRHGEQPPGDPDGFLDYAKSLRTTTIHDAIQHAQRVGEIVRFGFRESTWRHFDRLASFPGGLLPVADGICRFNPVYGQGMSVAAQEAVLLSQLLAERARERVPLAGLAQAFFDRIQPILETPWAMAAVPDFVYPQTRGERPADFAQALQFGVALASVAARDPAVHRLMAEVQNLLKPRSVYRDPQLVKRVLAEMVPS